MVEGWAVGAPSVGRLASAVAAASRVRGEGCRESMVTTRQRRSGAVGPLPWARGRLER
jgi:hypothetical protein